MDPDLGGSYEGSPPSLLDLAGRDRRWAQGNLQHAKVIGARGLRWPNRVHFAIGIGAYLMSPIWLAMIVTGLMLTAQASCASRSTFRSFQLFPDWPVFDAARMLTLLMVALGLLLLPKLIGLVQALLHGPTAGLRRPAAAARRLRGGDRRLGALRAGPDADAGRPGRRDPAGPGLRLVGADPRRRRDALAGRAVAALAPRRRRCRARGDARLVRAAAAGLAGAGAARPRLAPLASRLSGSVGSATPLARARHLRDPEDRATPPAMARVADLRPAYAAARWGTCRSPGSPKRRPARGPSRRARRRRDAVRPPGLARPRHRRAKVEAVEDPEAALGILTPDERLALAASPA
jgi:membrane glycosyltransferase